LTQAATHADFDRLFNGTLYSIVSWPQLEAFWQRLNPEDGWFLYAVGETRPESPADADHVNAFVREIDSLIRRDHAEDYCGIVYADNIDSPSMIKIYDPHHLGSSCGSAGYKILPGWVMSRMVPSDLHPEHIIPQNRRRWWQGFLGAIGLGA
jgi:hypothetical protein